MTARGALRILRNKQLRNKQQLLRNKQTEKHLENQATEKQGTTLNVAPERCARRKFTE